VARPRSVRRGAERRAGRPPRREQQSPRDTDASARRRRAAPVDRGKHRIGRCDAACVRHRARARLVHERRELASAGTRPRPEARPRSRRERAVPAVQHRPAHRRQRRSPVRTARATRRTVAGAADATGAGRPQHGRPRHPQRVRGRGTLGARVAQARARAGFPRHAAPRRAARTRRPGDRPAAGGESLHRGLHALEPHAQRRHHRPAPRHRPRGGSAGTGPLRPPCRRQDAVAIACRRAVLHDRRQPEHGSASQRAASARRRPRSRGERAGTASRPADAPRFPEFPGTHRLGHRAPRPAVQPVGVPPAPGVAAGDAPNSRLRMRLRPRSPSPQSSGSRCRPRRSRARPHARSARANPA
jgi:hypothetical protein